MKKIFQFLALSLMLSISYGATAQNNMKFVPGEMLVQFKSNVDPQSILDNYRSHQGQDVGLQVGELLSAHMNIYKVTYNPMFRNGREVVALLSRDEGVHNAQLNHYVEKRESVIPNDTEFDQQWHHLNTGQTGGLAGADIKSTEAWDITTGGLTAFGDTIVVCVIEGGNLNHIDLQPNAWVNHNEIPGNGIDDDGNGFIDDYLGWNVNSQSDQGVLQGGHGTQVMGMIGAKGDNELGVSGINWDVKIMSVAGENIGNEASVVSAYNYALVMRKLYDETEGDRGAFVVATNASWGIDGGDMNSVPIWNAFYDTLGVYGILNCGATANNNVNVDVVGDIPTASTSDYMVSVTATNHNDLRTFSAYGLTTIDLAAPGGNVFTTSGQNGYGNTSGTSFASPLTAGVIALLYSVPCESFMTIVKENPQLGADYVRYALMEGVDPVAGLQGFTVTGGRVNAFNSLNLLLDNCGADVCIPPFSFNYELSDDTLYTFSWNSIDTLGVTLRYRLQGEEEWIIITDVTGGEFEFVAPELCSTYEFEIASNCSAVDGELIFGSTRVFETLGCCIAPDAVIIPASTESEVLVSWVNGFALEDYEVYFRPLGAGIWTLVGTFSDEQALVEGLDSCATYQFLVRPSCAESFNDGTIVEIRTKGCGICIDNEFCENLGQSSFWEFIDAVAIGDYENESGNNEGYILFEESGLELELSQEYEITLTPGFAFFPYQEFFRVWIDFNQDGEFDENEIVISSAQGSTEALIGSIEIPESAILGSTRMRVAMKFVGNSTGQVQACEVFDEGETEDYCIEIVASTVSTSNASKNHNFTLYPNPSAGEIWYKGNLVSENPQGYVLMVHDITGKLVEQFQLTGDQGLIDMGSLENGLYLYTVLGVNDAKSMQSGKIVIAK